jgi:hypothetical protein
MRFHPAAPLRTVPPQEKRDAASAATCAELVIPRETTDYAATLPELGRLPAPEESPGLCDRVIVVRSREGLPQTQASAALDVIDPVVRQLPPTSKPAARRGTLGSRSSVVCRLPHRNVKNGGGTVARAGRLGRPMKVVRSTRIQFLMAWRANKWVVSRDNVEVAAFAYRNHAAACVRTLAAEARRSGLDWYLLIRERDGRWLERPCRKPPPSAAT